MTVAKVYLRIRRWVDRDLSKGPRVVRYSGKRPEVLGLINWPGMSMLVAAVPIFLAAAIEDFPLGGLAMAPMLPALALSFVWYVFIGWRLSRLMRASSLKSGRYSERGGRDFLSADYHDSEDGMLASRRRQKRR